MINLMPTLFHHAARLLCVPLISAFLFCGGSGPVVFAQDQLTDRQIDRQSLELVMRVHLLDQLVTPGGVDYFAIDVTHDCRPLLPGFSGTAVLCGHQRGQPRRALVLTARHVVAKHLIQRHRNPRARLVVTQKGLGFVSSVICSDAETDLALLRVHATNFIYSHTYFAKTTPPLGEPVLAIGYPAGRPVSFRSHIVGRGLVPHEGRLIPTSYMTGALNGGFSGGPVWNSKGLVSGLVWGTDDNGHSLAITLATIQRFLKDNGFGYVLDNN